MKIVIVDDNESMRKVLRALCEGEGHEVIAEFGDGVGLLNYVAEQRPDVVCLDFELPGLNGLELLVQMDVAVNQVDVVMITASDDPELKGHAADLGAKGFIHKPFEQAQVIDELKEIAQTRAIAARAEVTPEAVEPTPPPPAESMPQQTTREPLCVMPQKWLPAGDADTLLRSVPGGTAQPVTRSGTLPAAPSGFKNDGTRKHWHRWGMAR